MSKHRRSNNQEVEKLVAEMSDAAVPSEEASDEDNGAVCDDSDDGETQELSKRWETMQADSGKENHDPKGRSEEVDFQFLSDLSGKVFKCSNTERTARFRVKQSVRILCLLSRCWLFNIVLN
jgi:hypothetical protein